jgi:hypothetical protein
MRKRIKDIGVIPSGIAPIFIYCPKFNKKAMKKILLKVQKIATELNLIDMQIEACFKYGDWYFDKYSFKRPIFFNEKEIGIEILEMDGRKYPIIYEYAFEYMKPKN